VARRCTLGSVRGGKGSIVRTALALLAGAAFFASATSDAEAYAIKRTSHGELVHWEQSTVAYTIDSSVDRNVTHASTATASAMGSWSGTVGAPDLQGVAPDTEAPTKPAFDQKNGVFFMKGGYEPAGRALAITVLTYDNASGRILDADVIFNGAYSFAVLSDSGEADLGKEESSITPSATDAVAHDDEESVQQDNVAVYDLHHVVAHELGHSLGMNDEMGRKDALMYRYSAPNDATMRQPASDDIAGLAELYSTRLEGRSEGCGSATVAPKKPSDSASHAAMFATFGLLLFLVLRAKSDHRARVGFVLAASAATIAFMPSLSGKQGRGVARASTSVAALGHARAKVLATSTAIENGLFKTSYKLATAECRANNCPTAAHGSAWGGTIGNVTQEVGGYYAPAVGDEVNVSFKALPNALTSLTKPLAGRTAQVEADIRVLTRAQ
jgi:hypothetical protein